jgi:hypothetical protein
MHCLCLPIIPALLIAGIYIVFGSPPSFLRSRLTVTSVPAGQVAAYKPYTYFASAAYCSPNATAAWSCGGRCIYWFVGQLTDLWQTAARLIRISSLWRPEEMGRRYNIVSALGGLLRLKTKKKNTKHKQGLLGIRHRSKSGSNNYG